MATTAVTKSKNIAEFSINNIEKNFKSLKHRMDNLESNQKKLAKALILVTVVSTGFDISLIL